MNFEKHKDMLRNLGMGQASNPIIIDHALYITSFGPGQLTSEQTFHLLGALERCKVFAKDLKQRNSHPLFHLQKGEPVKIKTIYSSIEDVMFKQIGRNEAMKTFMVRDLMGKYVQFEGALYKISNNIDFND